MKSKYVIVIFAICCFAYSIEAQHFRQRIIKTDKYVPVLVLKDSLFLPQIDSLIFNSVYSEVISKAKVKIFNVECAKKENDYVLDIYMICQLHFLKNIAIQGCFEYKGYLFIWYGDIPNQLWKISTKKKNFHI
jgi:hypothetical protein